MPDFLRVSSLVVALGSLFATAPTADAQAPTLGEPQLRAFVAESLECRPSVFAGEAFPAATFEHPDAVTAILGPYTLKTTYYDGANRAVEKAAEPGPYSAVIAVVPGSGRAHRRIRSLYRVPAEVAGDRRFAPDDAAGLAAALGLDTGAVARQSKLVINTFKGRAFAELSSDPDVARLLAGLHGSKAGDGGPVPRQEDAFVVDRQRLVELKRSLDGTDKTFSKPFDGPRPIEGNPAPVVREGSAEEAGVRPESGTKIDEACRAFAADTDQAFTLCVVRHGVIVILKAYGTRDGVPMTVDTKSWMASVTKAMSATAMMMLIDQGAVGMDDRVDKFLPALRGIEVERPLTIRHLYTHTNGLNKWDKWNPYLPDLEDRVADVYPVLGVGREWAYNGVGYELGGKVIEAVSGEAVPLFYQHHLLGPLGCKDTEVSGTHADSFSVPLDMAKFGQLLLNEGAYGDLRFFRAESFRRMLPERLTSLLGPETTKTFGFGLDGSPRQFGHGAASAATFHVNVDDDLVVIMTRNKMGSNQDKYNGPIWDAIKAGIIRPESTGKE